jgi:hypothetical protein
VAPSIPREWELGKKSEAKAGNGTVFVSVTSRNFDKRRLILEYRILNLRILINKNRTRDKLDTDDDTNI